MNLINPNFVYLSINLSTHSYLSIYPGKPRRGMLRRAVFSDFQRKGLEKRFQLQKYISKPDRKKLAEKLGLKDSQVHRSDRIVLFISIIGCLKVTRTIISIKKGFINSRRSCFVNFLYVRKNRRPAR